MAEARAFIIDFLHQHPCADCGLPDPIVLEFDHIGTKRANVSHLVQIGAPPSRLALELAECEVVCVNCHRQRTAVRRAAGLTESGRRTHPVRARNAAFLHRRLCESGCVDCGCSEVAVLDFDHLGDKERTVSELARRECSIARLEAEIAKCVVRCANCHRRKTAADFGYYRHRAGEVAA